MQHLLIVGKNDKEIVKHWRQDWLYENTDLYTFFKERTWNFEKLSAKEVKGQDYLKDRHRFLQTKIAQLA